MSAVPDALTDPAAKRVWDALPESLQHATVLSLLRLSLAEDLSAEGDWSAVADDPAAADVTSASTLDPDVQLDGRIIAKEDGVVAGLPVAAAVFALVSPDLALTPQVDEGAQVEAGTPLATVAGPGPVLLTAERPALNVLGRLSGIATLTRRFVDAVAGTGASILDTRKTQPSARRLDKYAVQQGGGQNHRLGLFDMVLIKDNHIDGAGSITAAVERVRTRHGDRYPIEVEVKTLDELDEALRLTPDYILLDNMDLATMRTAVERAAGRVLVEASGNITLDTVRAVAETGVDAISVGALTHSAPAFDVSLRVD
jgi:nicotinate-nucleotide pyrophosphorylase (carboxylating)